VIATGSPRAGVDFDEQTLAPEVPPLERAISYKKGCYLGQEVVERVAARGHVNRKLVGLTAAAAPEIAGGSEVWLEGREVGRVTSIAALPDGIQVAMAMVRTAAAEPGTTVEVRAVGGASTARVSAIPSDTRPPSH